MRRLARVIVPIALLGGCAAPPTMVQPINTAAFTTATTFGIEAPPPVDDDAPDRDISRRLRAAVEGEIERTMSGKGYQPAALANADLRVSYRLASLGRVAPEDRENPMSEPRTSVGPGDPSSEYVPLSGTGVGARQGILLVTITEAKTGAVVWQATSEGIASSTASAVSAVTRGTQAALEKVPAASKRAP